MKRFFAALSDADLHAEPVSLSGGTGRRQACDLPLSGEGDHRHGKAGLRRNADLYLSCLRRWLDSDRLSGRDSDRRCGQTYSYLYWEGTDTIAYDFSQGFCVAGTDTAAFLEDALAQLGLTRREANEFIVYWLPQMQENPYNLIAFQSDRYTQAAKLTIDRPGHPAAVFMPGSPWTSSWRSRPEPYRSGAHRLHGGGMGRLPGALTVFRRFRGFFSGTGRKL